MRIYITSISGIEPILEIRDNIIKIRFFLNEKAKRSDTRQTYISSEIDRYEEGRWVIVKIRAGVDNFWFPCKLLDKQYADGDIIVVYW